MKFSWVSILLGFLTAGSFAAMEFKEAEITTLKNLVEHDPGTGAAPAKVNEKIREKSKVSTAAASMAELTFADSSITRMGANTQFSFQSKERLVKLDQGTILIHTPPGNGGATVDCGGVTAAVSGTTFMASHDSAGNVMFVLLEGQGGLKVTAGGSTTVIRPGQAASIGADVKKEVSSQETSSAPGGERGPAQTGGAATGKNDQGGSDAGGTPASGPGAGPAPSGGETPAPATPRIQVFDIDVKKVVSTTPLIVEFKNELPSAPKIEKTVEIQQKEVQEGKLEKTETEVVLIKHTDGDVMVGSPKVNPEESVVVNRKTDQVVAGGLGSENLDVETAAGPGAGAGGTPVAATAAPRVETPASPPAATTPPPVNPGQTAIVQPPAPVAVAVTARVNDASRDFNQANPAFGFSITSGSLLTGHSLVTGFLTTATASSGVAGSPYAINFSNPRIVDGSGADVTSRYNLTTVAGVLNVLKAAQNVAFGSLGSLTYNQPANLVANALGGTVTFQVVSGPGTIDSNGRLVATSGTGSVVVRATTSGDQNYNGAFTDQTIVLQKAQQTLTHSPVSAQLTGSTGTIPINGVMVGTPTFSILENDGRATVDSAGNIAIGKILGANDFTLRVNAAGDNNYLAAQKDVTVGIGRHVPAVEAANPVRRLLILPDPTDVAAFDEFFYFTGKTAAYSGGPSRFFAEAGVGDTDRTLAAPGASMLIHSSQSWDFFAARQLTALPGSTPVAISPSAGKTETVFYADQIDLGSSDPRWQGTVDPRTASTSLGYRYLTLNSDYLPIFDKTMVGSEPTGYLDSFGALLSPLENFPVWDDAGGSISVADKIQVGLSGSVWTLVSGSGGLAARGLEVNANGAGVQMLTSGDLNLKTVEISDVGLVAGGGENLTLEARGKVKMGTAGNLDLDVPTNAGLPEQQQVRLEGSTDGSGNALASSLAVVRTGDSLELRNVAIRGFAETRLEKLNPTTKALEGRVLISGSAVRDFKIKELVGAAVNADAKIQMMALDQNGALAGDMVVGGNDPVNRNRLPVEAKIASALKEATEILPTETAGAMVDAKQIDLAAGNLKFQNANLVAMNAITARANTILIQNSFMTVVRNQGMINMYVSSGLVNQTYGTEVAGRVNFAGINKFTIGNTIIPIGSQGDLTAAYGTNLIDFSQNGGTPQAGKVNVLKL